MKNFLKLFALFACFATLFAACNSDETVDDYTPKVKSFETYDMVAGSEKIHVTWTVPNDESITGTKISWSGATKGSHSISDLTANDQMNYTITGLKDGGSYTVTIESLVGGYVGTGSVFVSGLKVYGPKTYAKSTLPTMVAGSIKHDGDKATVEWTTGGGENVGVDITYTDVNGLSASAEAIFASSTTAELLKAQEGTYFTCKALFQPAGGYDYAEVTIEGDDFFIASSELTAATPEISNTLGGKEQVRFSWTVTEDVTKSVVQLYEIGTDGNTVYGSEVEISGNTLTDNISEGVATYTYSLVGGAGKSYMVEVTNYIDINSTSTPTQSVMSESSMFVYDNDTYLAPAIDAVVNDRGVVSVSWNMSGDKVIASDLVRIEFSYEDENGAQTATYDTYDAPLVLASAITNSQFTAKAYYMPANSIEGAENEIEKDVDVTTDGSNKGEIPAPILYTPQNVVLSPGYNGTNSYVQVSWDALLEFDFEQAQEIRLYYQAGSRFDITETGTRVVIDKGADIYTIASGLDANTLYYAVLATVNTDGYESLGDIGYVMTYGSETYANNVLNVKSIERSGDNSVDATITWDWVSAGDVAVAVAVTEYTGVDNQTYVVEKAKREDAITTTLVNVKGGTEVKYSAYYCPAGGLDSLAVAQVAITVPNLVVADAPALVLMGGVNDDVPYIQASWESFDYTNVASATLYYRSASEGGDYASTPISDVTTGVGVIEGLKAGVEYEVYMTLTDVDGVEHTPATPAPTKSPELYNSESYKEAASVTILSDNGASFDGTDLTIKLELSGASEELVGVLVSYETADGDPATVGNVDYAIVEESIPATLVLAGIKASSNYTITSYYRPSTGVTSVAAANVVTLKVPAVAPTVADVTGVVSSYNKSGDGGNSEITVNWTLADNTAREAIKGSKMYVKFIAMDAASDATPGSVDVDVESGVESYSVTLNTTNNGIASGKSYIVSVETLDSDSVPYVSNIVSGVKTYNKSSYTVDNIPQFTAEHDNYADALVVEWDAESLNADIASMSVIYNGNATQVEDKSSGRQSIPYVSSASSATMVSRFMPVAVESVDGVVEATYGETVDITSSAVNVVDMSYDILNIGDVYQIFTADGLLAFAGIVNGSYADSTPDVKSNVADWSKNTAANAFVIKSINLDGYTWTPINGYTGTFDGGNGGMMATDVTISNLSGSWGLFGSASAATIKNVTLENVNITSAPANTGAIVGVLTGTAPAISYCKVSGSLAGTGNIAAIVGSFSSGISLTIDNCTNSASISSTGGYVAGIIGNCYASSGGEMRISNCVNSGDVTSSLGNVAGIIAYARPNEGDGSTFYNYIENCTNSGNITGAGNNVGGIGAYVLDGNKFLNCTNTGTVTNTAEHTGGIVGQLQSSCVAECNNEGAVVGGSLETGGIVGWSKGTSVVVGNSSAYLLNSGYNNNSGTVSGTKQVGGIIGNNASTATTSASYYVNKGEVYVGGVKDNANYGVIGNGTAATDCWDYYTTSGAEAVSSVAAYPTFTTMPAGDESSIVVSWSFGEVDKLTNAKKVNVYYKSSDEDSYRVVTTDASLTSTSISIDATADVTYSVYVTTETADGVETSSDVTVTSPLSVVTYNSNSYDEKVPVIGSIANDGTTVTINWDAESLDADLESITITYGTEVVEYKKADLASAITLTYTSGVEAFSYSSTFKPAAYAANEAVASVVTASTTIDLPAQPAEAVSGVALYPSFIAGEGDEPDASTINVSWAYGESTSHTASVVVYYKKSTDEEYTPVILTGTSLTSYTLGVENETIDADATYNVYVATRNSENNDTVMSGDALEVETYNSSSYGDNMPKIASVDNDGTNIIVSWDAESVDADLAKVVINYAGQNYAYTTFSEPSSFVYDGSYAAFSYTATFKPAAYADNENVVSVDVTLEDSVTIPTPAAQEVAVVVYPSYTAGLEADDSNVTVEWAYDNGSSFISTVKIYYRTVGAENFEEIAITEDIATTTSNVITSLEAGVNYEVYVSTFNASGSETESNYTSSARAIVQAYNSSSYDAALVPSVGATHDGTDVTFDWANTDAEDLISVSILYNGVSTSILKSELATKGVAYASGVNTFTYSATFAPTENSTGVVIAVEDAVNIVAEGTDISLNGEVYEIYTAKGLAAFGELVNGTAATTAPSVVSNITDWTQNISADAKLMAEFSLSEICGAEVGEGTSWTPIGNSGAIYAGEFDGNGMTISDLYINTTTANQGLFGWVAAATIKDITLANIDVTYGGTVAHYAGPVVARMNGAGLISGCEVASGTINITTTGAAYVGGVVGNLLGRAAIDNCINRANITSTTQQVGGIVGGVVNGANETLGNITNCKNYGDLNVSNYAGGIVGYIQNGSATEECTVEYCENHGNITGTTQLSGIAGSIRSRTTGGTARVVGCVNYGKVESASTAVAYVGGVIGLSLISADSYIVVDNCTNIGDIYAPSASNVGGLVAVSLKEAVGILTVTNSNNSGDVTGNNYVGGIVARTMTAESSVTGDATNYSYNTGDITGTSCVGAIVGTNVSPITYYKNTGKVSPEQLLVGEGTAADADTCADEYDADAVAPAAEAVTAMAALNSAKDGIDVSWIYGESKANISKVVVYYKAADGATYTSKEVEGNTAESVSLTSEEGIELGVTYSVYVVTQNSEAVVTASNLTEESPASVEVPAASTGGDDDDKEVDIELVADVYQIYTAKGLAAFGDLVSGTSVYTADVNTNSTITDWTKDVDAKAMLMKDIDLSSICYPASDGVEAVSWAPIGGTARTYAGTFDGNDKKISNLYLVGDITIGLFGYTDDGTVIKNLTMENPYVECAGNIVAAIVGRTGGTTIENCHVTGAAAKIIGAQNVGAIVGTISTGTITGCTNYATIVGTAGTNASRGIGGIAGINNGGASGIIENCVNYGVVGGTISVGGIVGYVNAAASVISSSNEGTVTNSGNNTGGIVGNNAGIVTGAASPMSYNSGVVTGTGNVGGIAGNNTGTITNYENRGKFVSTTEATTVGGIVGASTGTVGDECADNYAGDVVVTADIKLADGTYEIYTAKGLEAFAAIVNAGLSAEEVAALSTDDTITEAVAQNVAANGTVKANITLENAWTPMTAYAGTFDGGNGLTSDLFASSDDESVFTISGLTIADATTNYQGLFATTVAGAVVKNVTLTAPTISSTAPYVGGVVASATGSTISYCRVDGGAIETTSTGLNIAGVVGHSNYSNINNCVNKATVVSGTHTGTTAGVGGVVGYVQAAADAPTAPFAIKDCINMGDVGGNSSNCTGGVVGSIYTVDAKYGCTVSGCLNSGTVQTGAHSGGVFGYLRAASDAMIVIENCHNMGAVNATGNNAGGVVGYHLAGSLYACSNSGAIISTADKNVGGIVGQLSHADAVLTGRAKGSEEVDACSYNAGEVKGNLNVGAIAGLISKGNVSYYNNSAPVWMDGVLQNGGADSKLVGSGANITNCVDEYTGDGTELQ